MRATTNQTEPSLTDILRALIPALILFIEAILADTTRPQSPALRRLARTLHQFRALAAVFGLRFETPASLAASLTTTRPQPPRRGTTLIPARNPAPLWPSFPIRPEPARTLEL